MSQNDYNIANQGFPATRSDLNSALQALASCSSGATEPATMYANQLWYDTTTSILKIRNEANSAWISYINQDVTTTSNPTFANITTTGIDDNATSTAITIDASENVGIGTSSPSAVLHSLSSGSSDTGVFERGDVSGTSRITIKSGDGSYGTINATDGGNTLAFYTGATEAMQIDPSGNLLVGKTDTATGTVGVQAKSNGGIYGTRDAGSALVINRLTSDGDIVTIMKDTVTVGRIGSNGSRPYFYGGSGIKMGLGGVQPCNSNGSGSDNDQDLGSATVRWDDIYATNGTIQTSDRNEKQDIAVMDAAETRVAVSCKGLLRKFRWKDAVADKGDDARIHFGIIAQDLQDAFTAEGLDAGRYAMFISSTWWETQTDVPAVVAVDEVLDEDGGVVTEAVDAVDAYTRTDTFDEVTEGATERTRLGVRYPELLAFIIGVL